MHNGCVVWVWLAVTFLGKNKNKAAESDVCRGYLPCGASSGDVWVFKPCGKAVFTLWIHRNDMGFVDSYRQTSMI